MKNCHHCGLENSDDSAKCSNCEFLLSDGEFYLAEITASDVPEAVAQRVLATLNSIEVAEDLARQAPLFEPYQNSPRNSEILLAARGEGFSSLAEVFEVENLSIGRLSELVDSLGYDDVVTEPSNIKDTGLGRVPLDSASRTTVEFGYELNPDLNLPVNAIGVSRAARCSSCSVAGEVLSQGGVPEVRVDVSKVIMSGEQDGMKFSISMDTAMKPYDYMVPTRKTASQFEFPAIMQLNNNMIMRVMLPGSDVPMTLRSKRFTEQFGKIKMWPPYGVRLHTRGPVEYFLEDNMEGPWVMRVHDATTFLDGPSNFLNHSANITSYDLDPGSSSVSIQWRPVPDDERFERKADYYFVYRSLSADPTLGWDRVTSAVRQATWRDFSLPENAAFVWYRVVPVWVTSIGEEFEGFPGQPLRIELAGSPFRKSVDDLQQ